MNVSNHEILSAQIKSASGQQDNKKNDWFNLFAELDPLSNPDALGSKGDSDRYC